MGKETGFVVTWSECVAEPGFAHEGLAFDRLRAVEVRRHWSALRPMTCDDAEPSAQWNGSHAIGQQCK